MVPGSCHVRWADRNVLTVATPRTGPHAPRVLRYLTRLNPARQILWCYLLWWLVVVARYFDPNLRLWLTSLGIAVIVGVALWLSTAGGPDGVKLGRWQVFRLFLMPFCVSSFAALVKGRGFVLVFSPRVDELALGIGLCGAFCVVVWLAKRFVRVPAK